MKKMKFLLVFLAFAGIVLTSCNDTKGPPTMVFDTADGYVFDDVTLGVGEVFTVGVIMNANDESNTELTQLTVYRSVDDVTTTYTSADGITGTSVAVDIEITAAAEEAVETFTFTLTDADDETVTASFDVTTVVQAVAVTKNADITLGSFNDPAGSFYSAELEQTYTITPAFENQADIDFLFFLGATNGSTFASPADPDANTIDDFNLDTWTTKNETLFEASTLTATDFDAIGSDYNFPEFTGTASKMNQLAAGDVITFKTVAEKLGLIKVNSINGKGDVVNIDVIFQD